MDDTSSSRVERTTNASVDAIEAAWAASSTVREFSGVHRTIRGLTMLFMPAVSSSRPGDRKRARAVADVITFTVEGVRYHHSLEDDDYWPAIVANGADQALLEPLILEHHQLDPILDRLDTQARALVKDPVDELALSSCQASFRELADHLSVHLDHEEPIFFPLLAQYLPDGQAHTLAVKAAKNAPRKGFFWIMAGATYAMRPREADEFLRSLPKPLVWSRPLLLRSYRKHCRLLGIDPTELSRAHAS
jgi:hemerythrin-like domain-containing protein